MNIKFGLTAFLFIQVITSLYADSPLLVIYIVNEKAMGSLHITSAIEWNRDDLDEKKREALARKNIFYRKPEGNKVVRRFKLDDRNIRIEMGFPAQEYGRRLNDCTRVELSVFNNDKLFFQSKHFGQHAETTRTPESGGEFRPQHLSVYKTGDLHIQVSGLYGKTRFQGGGEVNGAFQFNFPIGNQILNDDFMNNLAIMSANIKMTSELDGP